MKSPLPPLAIAAFIALAACNPNPKTEVVESNPDPMANQLAAAPKAELPPAIEAEKTFRCKDNSLVYVTFFAGHKQANVRTKEDGPATKLTAANTGDPLTAEGGWKMTGGTTGVELTQPGKGAQSCKA